MGWLDRCFRIIARFFWRIRRSHDFAMRALHKAARALRHVVAAAMARMQAHVWRDNLDGNGASIRMRSGGRVE